MGAKIRAKSTALHHTQKPAWPKGPCPLWWGKAAAAVFKEAAGPGANREIRRRLISGWWPCGALHVAAGCGVSAGLGDDNTGLILVSLPPAALGLSIRMLLAARVKQPEQKATTLIFPNR